MAPLSPHRSFLRGRRAPAVWLLTLFVLGQLLSFAHHVGTEHSFCAAEGERVHGHCHHDSCSSELAEARKATDLDESTPSQPELERQGEVHEHGDACSILTPNEGRGWIPVQPILSSRQENVVRPVPTAGADRALGGIPLYRLAPKQSPPELS